MPMSYAHTIAYREGMGVEEEKANETIIQPRSALATFNMQKFFPDKKKWVRYGLANPRIAVVLVIPKHNAPFHPEAHWLPISQPRNRERLASSNTGLFLLSSYTSV